VPCFNWSSTVKTLGLIRSANILAVSFAFGALPKARVEAFQKPVRLFQKKRFFVFFEKFKEVQRRSASLYQKPLVFEETLRFIKNLWFLEEAFLSSQKALLFDKT